MTYQVDISKPKATIFLQNLTVQILTSIKENSENSFLKVADKLGEKDPFKSSILKGIAKAVG